MSDDPLMLLGVRMAAGHLRGAQTRADGLRKSRDAMICAAVEAGVRRGEIAKAAGVTRVTVWTVAKRGEEEKARRRREAAAGRREIAAAYRRVHADV